MNVGTMTNQNAWTTSNVSVTVGDKEGNRVVISNLVDWNHQPQISDHVYFQSEQLDKLVGPVDCKALASQPCFINITISGAGSSPDRGCGDIEVSSRVVGNYTFYIQEWFSQEIQENVARQLCPRPSKGTTSCTTGSLTTEFWGHTSWPVKNKF